MIGSAAVGPVVHAQNEKGKRLKTAIRLSELKRWKDFLPSECMLIACVRTGHLCH
jgi:hypothetical protein